MPSISTFLTKSIRNFEAEILWKNKELQARSQVEVPYKKNVYWFKKTSLFQRGNTNLPSFLLLNLQLTVPFWTFCAVWPTKQKQFLLLGSKETPLMVGNRKSRYSTHAYLQRPRVFRCPMKCLDSNTPSVSFALLHLYQNPVLEKLRSLRPRSLFYKIEEDRSPVGTQRKNDVAWTLYGRCNDVKTLKRRCNNVFLTTYVGWKAVAVQIITDTVRLPGLWDMLENLSPVSHFLPVRKFLFPRNKLRSPAHTAFNWLTDGL